MRNHVQNLRDRIIGCILRSGAAIGAAAVIGRSSLISRQSKPRYKTAAILKNAVLLVIGVMNRILSMYETFKDWHVQTSAAANILMGVADEYV